MLAICSVNVMVAMGSVYVMAVDKTYVYTFFVYPFPTMGPALRVLEIQNMAYILLLKMERHQMAGVNPFVAPKCRPASDGCTVGATLVLNCSPE